MHPNHGNRLDKSRQKAFLRSIPAGIITGVLIGPLLLSLYEDIALAKVYAILLPIGIVYVVRWRRQLSLKGKE